MLTALSIANIVLIERLDLDFEAGLGVLTGETGAGKSILLDALGLALGMRADSALVRQGTDKAQVTASFTPPSEGTPLAVLLAENEVALEPGEPLLIRRTLKADGGSRAFLNDQPCSAALLREVGGYLVEIHGQHDDRGLLAPAGHRALLDVYARADTGAVAVAHAAWRAAEEKLAVAKAAISEATRDREWLEHCVAELQKLDPQPGEEAELAEARAAMQKGEKIAGDLGTILEAFDGSDGGPALLRGAARRLDRLAGDHPLLAEALAALDRAIIDADDAETKLHEAARALEYDPDRLEAAETRLFELRAMARKHGVQPDELAELAGELAARLDAIEGGSAGLAKLEAAVAETAAAYTHAATALSDLRAKAAARLDAAVAGELVPLKLDAARFQTAVERLPAERWGADGIDRVEFLISTNPGAPFAPLAKIASGGELSRFILALKVALAEEGGADTIIFDEIDRGVGGAVASAIGERLARLSRGGKQLLAVTHSPQVAAKGASHFIIAKSSEGTVTRTGVRALDEAGRREEIARMLSGAEVTEEARAQAERLLETI
ncbi:MULTISPECIES: DNA repair protein RecN [unclassified Sphingopyxis]|uniref:DNA repair protein RecN n=1 Tax=unclassified Sphingopyxis TaxID=2614943 RepID=UPI0007312CBC|nr:MULTISPECIES: DNA repair protein RecN [unclassified Sphingopyxis]KTE28107.1 DNA repair protein RecN [Sphingopyxis sp. H057]KTE55514.1 DNA repair protein RecN [Sphingopyxis sp. H073]KTE57601.1 DNA repair protein RecN [Sphingopyxis sp. H071]KTE61168.1 DNA repair protein RecN [Sphingopyxis sp. H107]KTE66400.1 DNA repair protein RecN [Sphingopyxis sp. H100]